MVKKGQKFNKYSPEIIAEILEKYHSGQGSSRSLGKEYGVSFRTIDNWLRKEKKGIEVTIDHRKVLSGRAKEESINYKERYEILKKYQAFIEARRGEK